MSVVHFTKFCPCFMSATSINKSPECNYFREWMTPTLKVIALCKKKGGVVRKLFGDE